MSFRHHPPTAAPVAEPVRGSTTAASSETSAPPAGPRPVPRTRTGTAWVGVSASPSSSPSGWSSSPCRAPRRDAVLVVFNLAGMQGHPQPNPLLRPVRVVVFAQRIHQLARQGFHEGTLGHVGRRQNEHAIASILLVAVRPRDAGRIERVPQGRIQARRTAT